MTALEVIRRVEERGGILRVEANELKVAAPTPLPADLMAEIAECKPAIMIALGGPIESAVASILREIRPYLSPALKKLPDDRLLALINGNVIAAWNTAMRKAGEDFRGGRGEFHGG